VGALADSAGQLVSGQSRGRRRRWSDRMLRQVVCRPRRV